MHLKFQRKAAGALGLCAAFSLFSAGCGFFDSEQPMPFEISKMVLPKDIPPPGDERNGYPDNRTGASAATPGFVSEKDLLARRAAAEEQERLHARSASKASPSDLVKVRLPGAGEGGFLTSKSFVTRWNILGPIPASASQAGAADFDPLQAEYLSDEKSLDGAHSAPEGASWNVKVFSDATSPGLVDLSSVFNAGSSAAAYYATACLDCPEDIEGAFLLVGSSMPVKIWLNGVLVHTFDRGPRELKLDQDSIDGVYLKKGYNRLVVKCIGVKGESARKFMLRFASAGGAPISTEP